MTAVRVIAENLAEPLDRSRPARPPEMVAAALGADRLAVWLGLRRGRCSSVNWGRLGNHRLLALRDCRRRSLDRKLLVTGLRAHLARGFAEKDAGASGSVGSGMNDQSDLVWGSEIAGMDLLVAPGEEDPAADVGVDRKRVV